MPTPFYHLSIAEELSCHPCLPGEVRRFLAQHRCAFLFGNTAADVQVVSGQSRLDTHFFDLPIRRGAALPWEHMLQLYPSLTDPQSLPGTQAAFLSGYLCHLQADWFWVNDIFAPAFGPACTWGTFYQRLYLHNVLRAYLDRQVLPALSWATDVCLGGVSPQGWLPFVRDDDLCTWRDLLFSQLRPGAVPRTVEVFAARQGISSVEYYALLESEERMQGEVFAHLPVQQVESYRQRLVEANIHLLAAYLAFTCQRVIESRSFQAYAPSR